jgi:hypothetical protein
LKYREHREHRQRANPEFVCARVAKGHRVFASISPGFSPLMAANLGQGRRTTISFLKDSWFQAGVEDFLAGLPPNQRALDERSVAEALAYEYGRLFAAHCTALGRLVPCLPRRGDRERDCRDAPHEYHRAQFVERSGFPKPFLAWKRAVRIACGLGCRETLRSKAAV